MPVKNTDVHNAAKNLDPRPSKRIVKSTVTKLVRDIDRTRTSKSAATKRKILLRIAKLMTRAVYASLLVFLLKQMYISRGIPKLIDEYAEGTLAAPVVMTPAADIPASVIASASKLYDYSEMARGAAEAAEFWYDKLGRHVVTGAKFIGGAVAWRANPRRRMSRT